MTTKKQQAPQVVATSRPAPAWVLDEIKSNLVARATTLQNQLKAIEAELTAVKAELIPLMDTGEKVTANNRCVTKCGGKQSVQYPSKSAEAVAKAEIAQIQELAGARKVTGDAYIEIR